MYIEFATSPNQNILGSLSGDQTGFCWLQMEIGLFAPQSPGSHVFLPRNQSLVCYGGGVTIQYKQYTLISKFRLKGGPAGPLYGFTLEPEWVIWGSPFCARLIGTGRRWWHEFRFLSEHDPVTWCPPWLAGLGFFAPECWIFEYVGGQESEEDKLSREWSSPSDEHHLCFCFGHSSFRRKEKDNPALLCWTN